MAKKKERYVVGLDVGTHKVCAIVAEITEEGRLDVIGIGQAESKGLRKGVVINLEATVDSIKRVVEEAELMAGVEIGSAYVGLAGTHIRGFNSRGVIAVSGKNRVIERDDVARVIPHGQDGGGRAEVTLPAGPDVSLADALDQHERELIARALSAARGNVAEAARRLSTDRANLYRRMRRLGVEPPRNTMET